MSAQTKSMEKPAKSWSRDRLVQWIEDNGDETARKTFLANVFDRTAKKLSKDQLLNLCMENFARTSS